MTAVSKLTEQQATHDKAIAAAKGRARELELAERQVAAQIAELTERIVEAHAGGDDASAGKLRKERGRLEQAATRTAAEKVAGAKRALARAEADRGVFVANNLDALLSEAKPAADLAVAGLREAVDGIGAARAAWVAVEQRVVALLRLAGERTDTAPLPADVEALARSATRVATDKILAPIPVRNAGLRTVDAADRVLEGRSYG